VELPKIESLDKNQDSSGGGYWILRHPNSLGLNKSYMIEKFEYS
jgi:hypothetical protein